jgi:pyruvate/2-oxoglutarate dehydrogenase complex dihydrolipoamide acyltransferase (E2) component
VEPQVSGTIEIKVPDIGDFSDIPVIEVLVSAGDEVKAEQSLITLESDKATMEIPSPADGVIREMKLKLDDTVSEGDVVALLEAASPMETSVADEGGEASDDPDPGSGDDAPSVAQAPSAAWTFHRSPARAIRAASCARMSPASSSP